MPDYRGAPDTDVFLQINCAYATGITGNGMDIRVTYNKTILNLLDVSKSSLTQGFTMEKHSDTGTVHFGLASATALSSGSGRVATLNFQVTGSAGKVSPLYIADYTLGGEYGDDLSWSAEVLKEDGSLAVESALLVDKSWILYE